MRFSYFAVPVILGLLTTIPTGTASAQVAVDISVRLPPPALPIYVQPPLPEPGYIWTPGYWAYADNVGYYWIPGTWVQPPSVGLLWTPPWWGFAAGFYGFHAGYWGPHVGFYGGINYGFGYPGSGFVGGRWDNGHFAYNSAVNNFGRAHVTNVYRQNVVNNTTNNRVSFNGGKGGAQARATAEQTSTEREQHVSPTGDQARHFQAAAGRPALRAATNHGRPAIAATARPAEFSGRGVVAARGGARPAPAAARGNAHAPPHGPAARPAEHAAQQRAAPAHEAPQHDAPQRGEEHR